MAELTPERLAEIRAWARYGRFPDDTVPGTRKDPSIRELLTHIDALEAEVKRLQADYYKLEVVRNEYESSILAERDAALALLAGFNVGADCLICQDSDAKHNNGWAGCPCCWTAPKKTLTEVMQWNYDNGQRHASDAAQAQIQVLRAALETVKAYTYAWSMLDSAWTELNAALAATPTNALTEVKRQAVQEFVMRVNRRFKDAGGHEAALLSEYIQCAINELAALEAEAKMEREVPRD